MAKRFFSAVAASCLLFIASGAHALPRYAAMMEQKCGLCHVSPTGCWMRNSFGAQFFALSQMPAHKTPVEQMSRFQPMVSDNISLGMDMRLLYIYSKRKITEQEKYEQSTFFQMEGNFYVNAQLGDRFSMALYKDLYSGFQVWGTANILPHDGYIRAGKFQPAYGWRFADHTSFVRERMLWPSTLTDTGLEFGLYPSGVSLNVGFFNGDENLFDANKGKAVAARAEFRKHIGGVGAALGGSYWRNDQVTTSTSMYGPFYYLNFLGGSFIYLGEVDWVKYRRADSTAMATTHNLSFKLMQGIWLEGQYDYLDPTTKIKNGSVSRYGFSIDYFPYGYLEVQPYLRYNDNAYSPDASFPPKDQWLDFHTEIHFFF